MSGRIRNAVVAVLLVIAGAAPSWAVNDVTIDGNLSDWSDEACFPDDICNDFTAPQQDGKGSCLATNFASVMPATTLYLRFDFNDTSVSGMNTLDGCWLVDSDQDGNANAALCFSLGGSPLVLSATRFFTCNDSSTSCGGPLEVLSSAAACAVNNNTTGSDILLACVGDLSDAAVECSIPLSETGWTSGNVVLLDGCTSTSAQPNSSVFDCTGPLVVDPTTPVELMAFSVE